MIKFIIARGIGFSPGSAKWIVTHGLAVFIPPPMIVASRGGYGDSNTPGGEGDGVGEGGGVG